jgi:hypothetical protein
METTMGLPDLIDGLTGKDDEKIRTNERALVVLSELSDDKHAALYEFVEKSGIALSMTLAVQYRKIVVLSGKNAESHDFVGALKDLAAESKVQKIDVLSFIHGNPGKMYFSNGVKTSDAISADIAKLDIKKKLRMYFTTACYGSSHAEDMIRAGFNCAAGPLGVCANSAVVLPEFITLWATGSAFEDCVDASQNPTLSKPFEDKAKKMGFSDVDSTNRRYGTGSVRITTNV